MFCEMCGGIDSLSERELLTDRFYSMMLAS